MIVLTIEETEKGLAILLSPEAQELLGATAGKHVGFEVTAERSLLIGPLSADLEEQLKIGGELMRRYDWTFKTLAKT